MANTVKGFFPTIAHAKTTKSKIAALNKISPLDMQVYDQVGFQATIGTDICSDGFFESLKYILGIGPTSQALCPEGVRRGGPVLEIKADEQHIEAIADVLDRCGTEDISIFTAAERD